MMQAVYIVMATLPGHSWPVLRVFTTAAGAEAEADALMAAGAKGLPATSQMRVTTRKVKIERVKNVTPV